MPKGFVAEREVRCRACRRVFRSTRCGKGAFYCGEPECTAERRRSRLTTPNNQASAGHDREHREALRMDREREREQRQRAEAAKRVRARLGVARARLDKALTEARSRQDAARALAVELAALEGRPASTRVAPAPSAVEPRVAANVPTAELAQLMEQTQRDVAARTRAGGVENKVAVRRAVVDVANAVGVPATRSALHVLGVEALAWEYRLRGGGRELGQAGEGSGGVLTLDPVERALLEMADALNARIADCHEETECPRCGSVIGERCVSVARGRRPRPLKHPHRERWTRVVSAR